jgi:hypothetical protein
VSVIPVHYLAEARNDLGQVLKKLDQLRDRDTHEFSDPGLEEAADAIRAAQTELGRVYQRIVE